MGGRGFDSRGWSNTQSLKVNDGTAFALQTARPLLGSYVDVKWRSRLKLETLKYGDFVTNSYGESWDSSCERS